MTTKTKKRGRGELLLRLRPSNIDREALDEWFGGEWVETQNEVAREFGLSPNTIKQSWASEGMPGAGNGRSSRYELAAVAEWRLRHLEKVESRQRSVQELNERELKRRTDEAEARKLEAQAQRLEFDNQVAQGDWVRVSDVTTATNTILAVLAQRMMDFPHKLAPSLSEPVAKQVVPFVQGEIEKLLKWCSEELRRKVSGDA